MANNKIRKKNTKYQSNQDYDGLVKGGKDVFFSACIVAGSALGAAIVMILAYIFEQEQRYNSSMDKVVEEEKTYTIDFRDGAFVFTDNATHKYGEINRAKAIANANQIDVHVTEEALEQLEPTLK